MADSRTPADELREAAELMRQRAHAATRGPWLSDGSEIYSEFQGGPWVGETLAIDDQAITEANSAHIASWHPAVAVAVADWLDGCAALSDMTDANYADGGNGQPTGRHWALAVARAYLSTEEVA